MHNLKPYTGDAFSLYKDAVENKEDGDSKTRLKAAETTIQSYYAEFDSHFPNNTLRSIPSKRVKTPLKDDLYDMYSFDAAIVKKVKNWLKENNPVTVYGICQYCGVVPFDTMDHILPHTIYAEYAVHARNLIPCCTDCNRRKNERETLNLYIDALPDVEYLFMDVKADGDTIDLTFRLDNSRGLVNADLFAKISNHFSKLKLFDKFKTMASTKVVSFVTQINGKYLKHGKQEVIDDVNEGINDLRNAYGFNYWEAAFMIGLVNSDVFWDYYTNGKLI